MPEARALLLAGTAVLIFGIVWVHPKIGDVLMFGCFMFLGFGEYLEPALLLQQLRRTIESWQVAEDGMQTAVEEPPSSSVTKLVTTAAPATPISTTAAARTSTVTAAAVEAAPPPMPIRSPPPAHSSRKNAVGVVTAAVESTTPPSRAARVSHESDEGAICRWRSAVRAVHRIGEVGMAACSLLYFFVRIVCVVYTLYYAGRLVVIRNGQPTTAYSYNYRADLAGAAMEPYLSLWRAWLREHVAVDEAASCPRLSCSAFLFLGAVECASALIDAVGVASHSHLEHLESDHWRTHRNYYVAHGLCTAEHGWVYDNDKSSKCLHVRDMSSSSAPWHAPGILLGGCMRGDQAVFGRTLSWMADIVETANDAVTFDRPSGAQALVYTDGTDMDLISQVVGWTWDRPELTAIIDLLPPGSRRARLALCRNVLFVEAMRTVSARGVYVSIDMDCVLPDLHMLHLATSFLYGQALVMPDAHGPFYDVVTANNYGYRSNVARTYRDKWALRNTAMNIDCWDSRLSEKKKQFLMTGAVASDRPWANYGGEGTPCNKIDLVLHQSEAPFNVTSAFNGLAIYSVGSLNYVHAAAKNCRYDEVVSYRSHGGKYQTSEHVAFHECLSDDGMVVGVLPWLLNCCAGKELCSQGTVELHTTRARDVRVEVAQALTTMDTSKAVRKTAEAKEVLIKNPGGIYADVVLTSKPGCPWSQKAGSAITHYPRRDGFGSNYAAMISVLTYAVRHGCRFEVTPFDEKMRVESVHDAFTNEANGSKMFAFVNGDALGPRAPPETPRLFEAFACWPGRPADQGIAAASERPLTVSAAMMTWTAESSWHLPAHLGSGAISADLNAVDFLPNRDEGEPSVRKRVRHHYHARQQASPPPAIFDKDDGRFHVAIHIRRADVSNHSTITPLSEACADTCWERVVLDHEIIKCMRFIRDDLEATERALSWHIFSDHDASRPEVFENMQILLRSHGFDDIRVHLGNDLTTDFHAMVSADALMLAPSSLSWVAAYLSESTHLYRTGKLYGHHLPGLRSCLPQLSIPIEQASCTELRIGTRVRTMPAWQCPPPYTHPMCSRKGQINGQILPLHNWEHDIDRKMWNPTVAEAQSINPRRFTQQ